MDSGSPTRNKLTNAASMRSSSQGKLQGHKKLPPLEDAPSTQLTNLNTTKSLQHKRDLIDALRRTNPASVNTAPNIFWDVEGSLKTTTIDDSDVKQQMTIVENGVNYSVKRYNDLKVINERLVKVLKTRLDELEQQKKSWENLDAMKNATTEEGMRIENLNKETEAIQRSISEKTHYSRKLDHMLNRLKNNQLKFDAHMVGMEDTMRSIQKDCADVVLMRRGLDAGLAKAVIVYEESKLQLSTTRKDREVLLEQRKVEYKNAKALQHWLKERERMKIELGIELRGDLTLEEEKFLKSQIDEKMERTKSLQKASEEGLRKLQAMEEAFTKLKQVTGVKNVEEMHEKFSTQKSNKLQLELEVKDAEHRLASAKKAFQKLETTFQELKSSGSGVAELNRDNINRLEELYSEARNDQKSIRADSDRISTVLLGLHQGAQGLLQRVQPYQYLTEGGVFELTQLGEETSPWTETVDALTTAEHILSKMMEAIAGDNATPSPGGYDEEDDNDSIYSRETTSLETAEEAPDAAYNIRIKSHRYLRETEPDEEYLHVFDTRVDDGEHNVPSEAKETGGEVMEDSAVPSRISVKKGSSRVTGDAKRKEEMAARRKRLQDRMENKGKDANLADDPNIGLTAKLKEQKKYAEKLCTTKSVPTLPEGVTLRDDPMTKTNAFLKLLPQLK